MRAYIVALSSVVAAVFLANTAREAAACTCPSGTLVSPRDGATNVPLNAVIVFEAVQSPVGIYDVTHGLAVPSSMEPFGAVPRTWLIRPDQPLAPNADFEVRPAIAPGGAGPHFTTGAIADDAAPTFDGFASFDAQTFDTSAPPCRNSCWAGNTFRRMHVGYAAPPDDTALLLMEVYREKADGTPAMATVPLYRPYAGSAWPQLIDAAGCVLGVPPFEANENVCARLVAFDMAGHRSENPREIRSRAVACAARFDNACSLADECSPEADASTGDAGLDGSPHDTDAATPPTSEPGADAGASAIPLDDVEIEGCSLSRGPAIPASATSKLFLIAFAGASWVRRHRRRIDQKSV